jgi:hypothetical protein
MKAKAIAKAEADAKAIAKASAKVMAEQKRRAKAKVKALGIGGVILILATGSMAFGTSIAFAPTKAEALVVQATKKEATLKKYQNADVLTDTELVELLSAVGFTGQDLKEAWAVAKKETNGRPLAHNGNKATGDNSYGLFQINMIADLGVARREQFGLESNAELLNPVVNATIAYHMSDGGKNWSAWKGLTPKTKEWIAKFPTSNTKAEAKAKAVAKA